MADKPLTELESLSIITKMIEVAKENHRERGDGWLIWGWLLLLASVLSAVFSYLRLFRYIGITWLSMLAVGLTIILVSHFVTKSRKQHVPRTYVQELLDRISGGFFLSLFAIIAANIIIDGTQTYGFYYILYGFWMFIYGSVLRFRPLMIGAYVNWAAAIAMFLINNFFYSMIISAVAILIGYIVPGYILRMQYQQGIKRGS